MFHRCQRAVVGLQSRSGHCTEQEGRLLRNVISSLAQSLQELSTNFRHTQSSYLKRKYACTLERGRLTRPRMQCIVFVLKACDRYLLALSILASGCRGVFNQ